MTMLDVPVVYTVETNDCESILTECQEALEAVLMDIAIQQPSEPLPYVYIRCLRPWTCRRKDV